MKKQIKITIRGGLIEHIEANFECSYQIIDHDNIYNPIGDIYEPDTIIKDKDIFVMKKNIYIQVDGIKHRVQSYEINSGSNYNVAVHVFVVGEKMPITGTVVKSSDDVKETAKSLLNNFYNK